MANLTQRINPRTGFFDMSLDPNSIIIPDGIPSPWDASGGTFPTVVAGTPDRWVIEVAGTLPAPVGDVKPQDFIIYDGTNRTVIHSPTYPLIIDITYAALKALKTAGELIPGMKYKITDFQNVSPLGNVYGEYVTGPVEELIVTATSTTEISQHAISMQYPQDIIRYDFDDNQIISNVHMYYEDGVNGDTQLITIVDATKFRVQMTGEFVFDSSFEMYLYDALADGGTGYYIEYYAADLGTMFSYTHLGGNLYEFEITDPNWGGLGATLLTANTADGYVDGYFNIVSLSRNGYITYRKDPVKNIETNYDFRTVKSRFWAIDLTGKTFVPGNTYNRGDWVVYNNRLYMATYTHSVATNPSTYAREWIEFFDYSNPATGYCLPRDGTTQRGMIRLPADSANYQDIPVFSTSSFTYNDFYIKNYKNLSPNNNYPVVLSASVNGPTAVDIDLGTLEQSIFFRVNTIQRITIKGGYNMTLAVGGENVNIQYANNCGLTNPRKWDVVEIKYSALRNVYSFTGIDINRLYNNLGYIMKLGYIYEVIIGTASQQSKNVDIEYAVNTDVMKMVDARIKGECYGSSVAGNTFSTLQTVVIDGKTRNNTSLLSVPFPSLKGSFTGFIYNNYLEQSVSGTYNNFYGNYIYSSVIQCTATDLFSGNYINTQSFSYNNFTRCSNNGTLATPLMGRIENNNIAAFENNMTLDNSCRISSNICMFVGTNNFYGEFKFNNITYFGENTIELYGDVSYNTLNYMAHSLVSGVMRYNNGNMVDYLTCADFQKNMFNNLSTLNLTAATIVADGGYSKNIFENNDGGYSVSYFNSATGLNYDTVTT